MPAGVLIDTSLWIDAMRLHGDAAGVLRVQDAVRRGKARFCGMVRLELWAGVRGENERRWLRAIEEFVPTVPTGEAVWSEAEKIADFARFKGLTAPATDLLIFACARAHGLELWHRDAHFDRLAQLVLDQG